MDAGFLLSAHVSSYPVQGSSESLLPPNPYDGYSATIAGIFSDRRGE